MKKPTSTIALTAYNWLATQPSGRTIAEISNGVRCNWDGSTSDEQVQEAMAALVEKRFVTLESARYDVRDQKRRVVVSRDRTDATGWSGWMVATRSNMPRVRLDEEMV